MTNLQLFMINKKEHFTLLTVVFLLLINASCSFLINNVEKEPDDFVPILETNKTICDNKKTNYSLISRTQNGQEQFNLFLKKLEEKKIKLASIDKAILWSLVQMNISPSTNSPTSRFQILIRNPQESKYWDFVSQSDPANATELDDISMPVFFGSETLLKYYKSKYSLKQIADLVDKHFDGKLIIDNNFRVFLEAKEASLKKDPIFKNSFFKGEDVLKKGERIPKALFTPLIKDYLQVRSENDYIINNKLYDYHINETNNFPFASCNFDLKLYKNSIFLVDQKVLTSNIFGIHQDDFYFLAITGQKIDAIKPLGNSFFFQGSSIGRFADLCFYNDIIDNKKLEISMISSQSRDPGQHLFHLFSYGFTTKKIDSIEQFDQTIKLPRHIFLTNPLRLIYESDRGNEKQLERLLKFSFPIYHTDSIANIWSYYSYKEEKGPIIDGRDQGHISCLNH